MNTKIPNILLIYTGGTIGMIKDYKTNSLKAFNFKKIKEKIPELNQLNCKIQTISFDQPIDSSNMNSKYWVLIAKIIEDNYHKMDGFVVLTGTDTMSYTASALSFMIENLKKPIIFTGSQLPIGDLRTDAKENLITAIQVAATQDHDLPIITEVGLYFEYKLYRANRTTKINAEHFDAFDSPNFPPLAESGVHLNFNKNVLHKPSKLKSISVHKNISSKIVILKLFPGIDPDVVQNILEIKDLRGVILETYGSGNAPTSKWFLKLLKKAVDRKIPIINVTQCIYGSVLMGLYETSNELKSMGVIDGKDITTESAIAKLKYLIGKNVPFEDLRRIFKTSIRGEMS